MTETQMDITACKEEFSSSMKDASVHISTFKFPSKDFSSASY